MARLQPKNNSLFSVPAAAAPIIIKEWNIYSPPPPKSFQYDVQDLFLKYFAVEGVTVVVVPLTSDCGKRQFNILLIVAKRCRYVFKKTNNKPSPSRPVWS